MSPPADQTVGALVCPPVGLLPARGQRGVVEWCGGVRALVAIVGVVALIAAACSSTTRTSTAEPVGHVKPPIGLVVATADGAVRGRVAGPAREYLGVPYAAPPVGPLRWRPPQAVRAWTGVRAARAFAPHCAQPASRFGVRSTSEDCLYLNVYAPATETVGSALPVMVWIHGGSLVWGESNDYDPAQLVQNSVIVVTINYRLGALGFLAHPALAPRPGGPSGNYGLMDQQAALRWVQSNIAKFGGDAHNVTLFGESAGGLSVLSQLASPAAHGLFSRAIAESGTYTLEPTPLATAEAAGEAFAGAAGCANESASCLRGLPVSTIVKDQDPLGYRPDVDGQVLTESLKSAFADGKFNRVPVIDGTNHDERRLFVAIYQLAGDAVTPANYASMIASNLSVPSNTAATIAAHYPLGSYPSPAIALATLWTDATFACSALTVDQSISKYVPTYAYEFNDENAPERYEPPVNFSYGAAHESEVQYLFGLSNTSRPGPLTRGQQTLASTMQQYWANLATRGSPSSPNEPVWPRFDNAQRVLSLVAPRPAAETDLGAEHDCGFWSHTAPFG